MVKRANNKKRSLHSMVIRHLRELHRKLGIFSALALIFLAVSGIALNHTEAFKLGHINITNQWLLQHYGVKDPIDVEYFSEKEFFVADSLVFHNHDLLLENQDPVIAIAKYSDFHIILSSNKLTLLDETYALVDQITSDDGLPSSITAISINNDKVILNTSQGYFQNEEHLFTWQNIEAITEPLWLAPTDVNIDDINNAKTIYKSQFLSLERIILDAHSGRIFGDYMVLFMDLIAIAIIILSLSGLYIWVRYARAKR
ncbi:PepSY domain-containing protein [Thalassotalea crassostreae]|uniref:PepSY domain-containing protein n=1 Tax=Thalassotalea crassostreae TaxID=1763536 RepID=UPI000837BBA3|nr:PepSY domain-containing protein [Thalassotalea crassostreae]